MRKLLLALMGLALLAGTPAFADTCIRQNDIRNWTSVNDKTLILENYRHQKVMLKLIGTCSDFRFRESIAIKSFGGSTGLSCVERGDTVITNGPGFSGRCAIVSVAPYTSRMEHRADHPAPVHSSY